MLMLRKRAGPGASSMFGLFGENGPFSVANDAKTLIPNPYRWTQNFSMIYIGAASPHCLRRLSLSLMTSTV